jgi:hypothetical protein
MIDSRGLLRGIVALFGPLLLAVCATQPTMVRWVKTGTDDAAVQRELNDCNAQADAALVNERGINQDISATLGGNWQLSGTAGIQEQAMRQQTAGFADRVLNNCMRAKGFTKEG